jgi:hypothetical protein
VLAVGPWGVSRVERRTVLSHRRRFDIPCCADVASTASSAVLGGTMRWSLMPVSLFAVGSFVHNVSDGPYVRYGSQ